MNSPRVRLSSQSSSLPSASAAASTSCCFFNAKKTVTVLCWTTVTTYVSIASVSGRYFPMMKDVHAFVPSSYDATPYNECRHLQQSGRAKDFEENQNGQSRQLGRHRRRILEDRTGDTRIRLFDSFNNGHNGGGSGDFFGKNNGRSDDRKTRSDEQKDDDDDDNSNIHFPSMMDELINSKNKKKTIVPNGEKRKKHNTATAINSMSTTMNGTTTNTYSYFNNGVADIDNDDSDEEMYSTFFDSTAWDNYDGDGYYRDVGDKNMVQNVMISNDGLDFVPTNGVVSEKINGQYYQKRSQHEHVTGQYPINDHDCDDVIDGNTLESGVQPSSSTERSSPIESYVNKLQSTKQRLEKEDERQPEQEQRSRGWSLAPEVRGWTSIMKRGLFFPPKKRKGGYTGSNKWKKRKTKTAMKFGDTDISSSFPEKVDVIYKELLDLSPYDNEQIDGYWDQLLPVVSYLGTEKVAKVYDALRVAYRAHRGQARKSGEPFIIHPVEVSLLLAGLKMDESTVMAGLLHDTVEDTDLTFELVEEMFGRTVRAIVEGETKVSKLPKLAFADYADEQAENLRQMFVAMTDDYRIIIVKLADRLHNMRTLKHMKPEKQIKISRETLDIFAPLAHRMGIWQFKSELEDTAFMYLYPQEYNRLRQRLNRHHTKFQDTLDKSQELLRERLNADPTLREQAASVTVSGRMKEIYSLWHKMETKNERNLDHIVDVVALRVIITPKKNSDDGDDDSNSDRGVWLCYHVLGLVQHVDGFQPVPTRVKDYISFPKPNGYQSLHTALILNGQKVEVQIRTSMMHQVAEYGMASHWAYTDSKRRMSGKDDVYNTPWLSSIKEWQNEKLNARDFVDSVRNELLGKRVFVFLRNGKILNLARGATAIDAAFQIHSEVGLNMHGVEINGKSVPISYELQNGDVVSILTGEGKPSTDWMTFAKSRSTRSKLRSYFRSQQKESLWEAGKLLLMDYLWIHGPLIEKNSYIEGICSIPTTVEELASMLPGQSKFDDVDELLITIGKQHDRALLHSFTSKLFRVPKSLLVDAEKDRSSIVPLSVLQEVQQRIKMAEDAAAAVASAQTSTFVNDPQKSKQTEDDVKWPKPSSVASTSFLIDRVVSSSSEEVEYADPEHICETCLPIWGDEIVGTRRENASADSTPCVHRLGCPIAQRALNKAQADNKRLSSDPFNYELGQKVDSVTLRRKINSRFQDPLAAEVPVKLEWAEFPSPDEPQHCFPCEVVVHAEDRKLLLADCSEIVSELSEILKTGSQTTNEHATLVFLIKIRCLDDLQKVMDSLGEIRSVMSVERRFGSELLGLSLP